MAESAEGTGTAGDATVKTGRLDGPSTERLLDYLRTVADEAEAAVPVIEKMIEGLKASLKAKREEAKQFRADADKAAKDAD